MCVGRYRENRGRLVEVVCRRELSFFEGKMICGFKALSFEVPIFVCRGGVVADKTGFCSLRCNFSIFLVSWLWDIGPDNTSKGFQASVIFESEFSVEPAFVRNFSVNSVIWKVIFDVCSGIHCFSPERLWHIGMEEHYANSFDESAV